METFNAVRNSHDPEPTFLTAITLELSRLKGGAIGQHLDSARQLLEETFHTLDRESRFRRKPAHPRRRSVRIAV